MIVEPLIINLRLKSSYIVSKLTSFSKVSVQGSDRESCRDACSEIMKLHNFSLSSLSIKILMFSIYCFWDYILVCCWKIFILFFFIRGMRLTTSFRLVRLSKGKMEREKLSQYQLFITAFRFCFLLKNPSLIHSVCVCVFVWLFIINVIWWVLCHANFHEFPWMHLSVIRVVVFLKVSSVHQGCINLI